MWGLSLLLFCGCCGLCVGAVTRLPGPHPTLDDVNECADSTICPTFSTCSNTIGSYYCACKQGFRSSNGQPHFTDPGVQCLDIDECSQSPSPCGPHSVCENWRGRYKCSCLPGFSSPLGDGWIQGKPGRFHCMDINECLNRRVCPEHSVCTNSEGSYSCSCRTGFVSNNSTCKDMDECADPRACPEHATCFNALGSYSCACNPGFESRSGRKKFQGLGEACEDVDECSKNSSLCGANSVCVNTPGEYNCSCLPGFFSASSRAPADTKALQCTDVDECADPRACPEHATCFNALGSYSCACNPGFESRSGRKSFRGLGEACEDVDECSKNSSLCGANSVCVNTPGEYNCSCLPGFFLASSRAPADTKALQCTDVDECADPRACPEHATCFNALGSYSCACNPGFESRSGRKSFRGLGEACEDVDECSKNSSLCGANSVCVNTPGEYNCSCLPGFFSASGRAPVDTKALQCTDVDECADPRACPEHATCFNALGSYSCACNPGFESRSGRKSFRGLGEACEDVDECSKNSSLCGANSVCINTPGEYNCSCLPGFFSASGRDPADTKALQCTDVDECAGPRACPEHATCFNALGSYSCACNPGFESRSGRKSFRGLGEACEDVDECSKNSSLCGANSVCVNTPGEYNCSCLPGFFSASGRAPVDTKALQCTDVDECADPRACPEHATCFNALGSYSCACNPGFESRSGRKSFRGLGEACEDVDECSKNSSLCGANSVCVNTPGEYNCSCLPGFFSASGRAPVDTKALQCTDIDECVETCPLNSDCTNTPGSYFCTRLPGFAPRSGQLSLKDHEAEYVDECLQDPSPCGPNSVCTNTPGSYSCGCTVGFRPHPEGSQPHGNFSCQRVPFKCREDVIPHNEQVQRCHGAAAEEPEAVSFCTLMNATFGVLDESCESKAPPTSLKTVAENFASVLEQASVLSDNFTRAESSALATVLLQSVESATVATLLRTAGSGGQCVRTQQLDIESKVIKDGCVGESKFFSLKAKGDKMKIGCSTVEEAEPTGLSGVAFVSFAGMESVLDERFLEDPWGSGDNSGRKLKMNSRVVGGITTGEKKEGFSEPIVYTLENMQPRQEHERPICVSWSTDVDGGRWTRSGCVILEASEAYTVCSCNRMANLAIIMASGELTLEFALYIISHTGMVISLLCLALAILTFLLCRSIHNHNTYLHLHLCVCLFLAKILFLVGIDKTEHRMGCAIIAGFLHYLFLACFFWMLLEAIILTLTVRNLKVVNYFSSRNVKMVYLCAFGYGLPALVVAVSAGIQPQGYGMHNRCWLNTDTGFVWSFLGPVCVIIKINSVLLTWTLFVLRQKLSSVNAEVSTLRDTRLLTFKAFAQLFILGCTWVLGIFQIGPAARVMAYLFTVVNSLQGAFIFLIHCLLSRQVREEYRRWLCKKPEPSSQSQTTGMVLLSTPSTSKTG